ncbi:MAG: ribosome-associated translation inhibitor RaiA [Bacteroidota bacterium]
MNIIVTSRHFKAHESLVEYAQNMVQRLTKIHSGLIKAEVILSYEKPRKSVKIAEVNVSVYRSKLSAHESSADFHLSIDRACAKLRVQLRKYKDKLQDKQRAVVRRAHQKI